MAAGLSSDPAILIRAQAGCTSFRRKELKVTMPSKPSFPRSSSQNGIPKLQGVWGRGTSFSWEQEPARAPWVHCEPKCVPQAIFLPWGLRLLTCHCPGLGCMCDSRGRHGLSLIFTMFQI